MASKTLSDYVELLHSAQTNLLEANQVAQQGDDYLNVAQAQTLTVKQFEIAIELLIKLVFKAAKELPEPEPQAKEMTWPQAFRLWNHMGFTTLPETAYNDWRKRRNLTSHTYREGIYEELIEPIIEAFDKELTFVLSTIKNHLPSN